jgi:hypothetical protein
VGDFEITTIGVSLVHATQYSCFRMRVYDRGTGFFCPSFSRGGGHGQGLPCLVLGNGKPE